MRFLLVLMCVACSAESVAGLVPSYGHLGDPCEQARDCLGLAKDMGKYLSTTFYPDCALRTPPGERICGFRCDSDTASTACLEVGGSCHGLENRLWCYR